MTEDNISTQQGTAVGASGNNGMATTGLVLGVIGFLLSWVPVAGIFFGWPLGVLAIIFSGIGIANAGRVKVGMGPAVTGLVLGILTVVFKSIPYLNLL